MFWAINECFWDESALTDFTAALKQSIRNLLQLKKKILAWPASEEKNQKHKLWTLETPSLSKSYNLLISRYPANSSASTNMDVYIAAMLPKNKQTNKMRDSRAVFLW